MTAGYNALISGYTLGTGQAGGANARDWPGWRDRRWRRARLEGQTPGTGQAGGADARDGPGWRGRR